MFFKKKQGTDSMEVNVDGQDIVESTDTSSEENQQAEVSGEKKFNWKKFGIIAGSIAGVALVAYIAMGVYFQSHFYFNSTVNGADTSGVSVETAKKRLEKDAKGYELKITDKDKEIETLSSDELGVHIDITDKKLKKIVDDQNGFKWGYYLFTGKDYVSDNLVACDDEKLGQTVFGLWMKMSENPVKTENANVKYEKGEFKVVKEVYGTEIELEDFTKKVKEKILNLDKSLDMTEDKCYKQPEYTSESKEIETLIKDLNKCVDTKITYTVGSQKEEVPKEYIGSWLKGSEEMKPDFNTDLMYEYVKSMASKYNTAGKPKTLNTQYGVTVTVPGGNYGWLIDNDKEVEQLKQDILAGKDVSRDFVYKYTAASRDGNDYGNTYVEINYTAQMVYLIVNGNCVMSTPCVTGNPNNGHYTPCGAYRITYCEKDAILKGDNYRTHVSYWMPFNGDIGLHDAIWQKSFGGQRYREGFGSHGCVNLPLNAAGTIFANVKTGYPVLLYELPGTETIDTLTKQKAQECMNAINAIGNVSPQSGEAIANARRMYEELTDSGKGAVTNLQVLIDSENAYNGIWGQIIQQQQAAEQAAAEKAAQEAAQKQNATEQGAQQRQTEQSQ